MFGFNGDTHHGSVVYDYHDAHLMTLDNRPLQPPQLRIQIPVSQTRMKPGMRVIVFHGVEHFWSCFFLEGNYICFISYMHPRCAVPDYHDAQWRPYSRLGDQNGVPRLDEWSLQQPKLQVSS